MISIIMMTLKQFLQKCNIKEKGIYKIDKEN